MPRIRITPNMPSGSLSKDQEGEAPAEPPEDENSMFFVAQQERCPAGRSVADVANEASPGIMSPVLDSNIFPVQDDMTIVDQSSSMPSAGAFANDRMFVRENPW